MYEEKIVVHLDLAIWLKRWLTSADEVHDASKCPGIYFKISVLLGARLRRRPLLKTSTILDTRLIWCYLKGHIQINHLDFDRIKFAFIHLVVAVIVIVGV